MYKGEVVVVGLVVLLLFVMVLVVLVLMVLVMMLVRWSYVLQVEDIEETHTPNTSSMLTIVIQTLMPKLLSRTCLMCHNPKS